MQTRTKVTIAAGLAVLLIGAAAVGATKAHGWKEGRSQGALHGEFAGPGGHHFGGHGKGHRGHRMGQRFLTMMESYDSDGDGKLTQSEIVEGRNSRLAAFDSDQDGALTLQEFEALWLDSMRPHMVDMYQGLDEDGDARVTTDEYTQPFAKMMSWMDRNDDGAIDKSDLRRGKHHWDDDEDDDDSDD